jgi:ACS family D-galactonate transporter-like MFS transporter
LRRSMSAPQLAGQTGALSYAQAGPAKSGVGSDADVTVQDRPIKGAWGMTALLFLFMVVNFADKTVLQLTAVPIMKDLGLSYEQFGLLGSSFFFLFAVSAVVVGFIANRIPSKWALLTMAVVWSLVQFPMVGLVSFEILLACRIILGAGEGPAAPIATHAVYKWFPDSLRAMPTAIVTQGAALGVIVAVPTLNFIIINYSWHWAFGALGIVGLLWAAVWLVFGREGTLVDAPIASSASGGEHIPYRHLLTCPTILALCFAGFASYWGIALGLTWFTAYLREGLGYDQKVGGNLSILPWLFGFFVLMIGSFISQRLRSRGASSRTSRGVLAAITMVVGGCTLPFLPFMPTPGAKVALLVFGSAIGSTIYIVIPMTISELTPQPQRAAMLSISTAVVTLSGAFGPWVMGWLIQHAATPLQGYEMSFIILGGLLFTGGIVGLLFIRPEADRQRLAAYAVARPSIKEHPARA